MISNQQTGSQWKYYSNARQVNSDDNYGHPEMQSINYK